MKKTSKITTESGAVEVKDGDRCKVIGGVHIGKTGTVRDLKVGEKFKQVSITVVQANGVRFKTLAKNVVVVR